MECHVVLTRKALNNLKKLTSYIVSEIKMPQTGYRYGKKMRLFAKAIGTNPNAWPICNSKKYSTHNYRCAIFDKKWVFVYSITPKHVVIRDVVNGKLIKE